MKVIFPLSEKDYRLVGSSIKEYPSLKKGIGVSAKDSFDFKDLEVSENSFSKVRLIEFEVTKGQEELRKSANGINPPKLKIIYNTLHFPYFVISINYE